MNKDINYYRKSITVYFDQMSDPILINWVRLQLGLDFMAGSGIYVKKDKKNKKVEK